MKNTQLFFYLLFITITTHCMEPNPWAAIDCHKIEQTLFTDYRNYCAGQLEEYKQTTFTPQHMKHIEDMAITYTGYNHYKSTLYDVRDKEDNCFPHIAIQKFDLPTLTWLVRQRIYYPKNKQGKGFIEVCIDHLSPHNNIDAEKKQIAYAMLNTIITNYGKRLGISLRKPIVENLIALQIEHRKQHNNNVLADIVLTPLLGSVEFLKR